MTEPTEMWSNFLQEIRQYIKNDEIENFMKWGTIKRTMSTNDIKYKKVLSKCKFSMSNINSIFEFGAGYGGMCRLIYESGFQGNYTIFDFPELHTIQKYYLRKYSIKYLSDISCLEDPPKNSLFISMSALEEAPQNIHNEFMEFAKKFDYYIFKYSGRVNQFEDFISSTNRNWHKEIFNTSVYLAIGK